MRSCSDGLFAVALVLTVSQAAAQKWRFLEPPARGTYGMTYDSVRGRTVVFGGLSDRVLWDGLADTIEFDGTSWRIVTTATSPGPRYMHAMVYDVLRSRVVLFGGYGTNAVHNDTLEYDGINWTRVTTTMSPAPRVLHAMAYDWSRGKTVLFGGAGPTSTLASNRFADTWEYDGLNWTPIATTASPTARRRHAMAYDLGRSRTLLFGGDVSTNDTWEYDGTTWTQIVTAQAPSGRVDLGLAYDIGRGRTVLYGGRTFTGSIAFGDTWEYDGVNWTQALPAASPGPRGAHSAVYDLARGRTIVLDGSDATHSVPGTWEYDGSTWTQVAQVHPLPRNGHSLAFDSGRGRTVMFGGFESGPGLLADTWEHNGTRWIPIATATSPSRRYLHGMVFDTARRRTVLFGGSGNNGTGPVDLVDTWEYDGTSWTQVVTIATPPPGTLAYDSNRGRTVLLGRVAAGAAYVTQTWEYDGSNWSRVPTPHTPPVGYIDYDAARSLVVDVGGPTNGSVLEMWEYDGVDWTQRVTSATPPYRSDFCLHYDATRGRCLLVGGAGFLSETVDVWQFDGVNWAQVTLSPLLRSRWGSAMTTDTARGRTLLFGGHDLIDLDDLLELQPAAVPTWTRYGTGCVGSAGTPSLDALPGAAPALGGPFTLRLASLPAQPGTALLAFGLGIAQWNGVLLPLPLDLLGLPGCKLWIAPAPGGTVPLAHPGAAVNFGFAIPAISSLAGQIVGAQAFVFDAAARSGLGSTSNGVILRLF
jgi:hypothetical protein